MELGIPELVVILLVVLLLFGPSRLPQAGAGLGKAIRSFKDAMSGKDDGKGDEQAPDRADDPPHKPELHAELPPATRPS